MSQITITRVVRSAFAYATLASALQDGNINTQADIQWAGADTVDYFLVDLGVPTIITAVAVANVVVTGDTFVELYGSNDPSLQPKLDMTGAAQFPVGNFGGPTNLFRHADFGAASAIVTILLGSAGVAYRYLYFAPRSSTNAPDTMSIGELVVNPVPPAPILTATATLIGNVPTIILSGQ